MKGREKMREEISLSGDDWRIFHLPPGEGQKAGVYKDNFWGAFGWLRADVPGDVHSVLIKRKIIEDPYIGLNNEKCRWVGEKEWWYKKSIDVPEEWRKAGRAIRLIFEGVDYDAEFWANGERLGRHAGMFSPIVFDVTALARSGQLRLAVCISPPPRNRQDIGGRKCNLGYGIDYSPNMPVMGIWKDVRMVCTGVVYIKDVFAVSRIRNGDATVKLEIEATNGGSEQKEITCEISMTGKNFSGPTVRKTIKEKIKPGRNIVTTELFIPGAQLWWPWDRGRQNLYRLEVAIRSGAEEQDRIIKTIGIREIKLLKNTGMSDDGFPFTFCVNGRKEYIRGANWTNINLLPGNMKAERYGKLLTMAKEANINFLRIHGWHIIEKEEFYNLCNELGILVWQEFMFCNMNYPQDCKYLKKVEEECVQAVKTVRNHPALAMWGAGNEYRYEPNKKLVDTLRKICEKHDPARYFAPPSDTDRYALYLDKSFRYRCSGPIINEAKLINEGKYKGDLHSWAFWFLLWPIAGFSRDECFFASEFGIQAVPDLESLKKFIPKDELWPPGYSWEYHSADISKLVYYAYYIKSGIYDKEIKLEEAFENLEEFICYSQKAQAEALKCAIEHYRCRKYRNSGAIFWSFNEPWPTIAWSVVDWYLKPKQAYQAVREAYALLLVALRHNEKEWRRGETFDGEVWIVNDHVQRFSDCALEIKILGNGKNILERKIIKIEKVNEDSAEKVFVCKWPIPGKLKGKFSILLSLQDSTNSTIASNEYLFRTGGK